jgi:HK97 gp10 family phage protein
MISPEVFAARLASEPPEKEWQAEWSKKMAEEMRMNAPVDTGALRASIQPTDDGVAVGVRYAAYVEYGTSRTGPQPYAVPAINRLADPAARDAGDRVIRQLT